MQHEPGGLKLHLEWAATLAAAMKHLLRWHAHLYRTAMCSPAAALLVDALRAVAWAGVSPVLAACADLQLSLMAPTLVGALPAGLQLAFALMMLPASSRILHVLHSGTAWTDLQPKRVHWRNL